MPEVTEPSESPVQHVGGSPLPPKDATDDSSKAISVDSEGAGTVAEVEAPQAELTETVASQNEALAEQVIQPTSEPSEDDKPAEESSSSNNQDARELQPEKAAIDESKETAASIIVEPNVAEATIEEPKNERVVSEEMKETEVISKDDVADQPTPVETKDGDMNIADSKTGEASPVNEESKKAVVDLATGTEGTGTNKSVNEEMPAEEPNVGEVKGEDNAPKDFQGVPIAPEDALEDVPPLEEKLEEVKSPKEEKTASLPAQDPTGETLEAKASDSQEAGTETSDDTAAKPAHMEVPTANTEMAPEIAISEAKADEKEEEKEQEKVESKSEEKQDESAASADAAALTVAKESTKTEESIIEVSPDQELSENKATEVPMSTKPANADETAQTEKAAPLNFQEIPAPVTENPSNDEAAKEGPPEPSQVETPQEEAPLEALKTEVVQEDAPQEDAPQEEAAKGDASNVTNEAEDILLPELKEEPRPSEGKVEDKVNASAETDVKAANTNTLGVADSQAADPTAKIETLIPAEVVEVTDHPAIETTDPVAMEPAEPPIENMNPSTEVVDTEPAPIDTESPAEATTTGDADQSKTAATADPPAPDDSSTTAVVDSAIIEEPSAIDSGSPTLASPPSPTSDKHRRRRRTAGAWERHGSKSSSTKSGDPSIMKLDREHKRHSTETKGKRNSTLKSVEGEVRPSTKRSSTQKQTSAEDRLSFKRSSTYKNSEVNDRPSTKRSSTMYTAKASEDLKISRPHRSSTLINPETVAKAARPKLFDKVKAESDMNIFSWARSNNKNTKPEKPAPIRRSHTSRDISRRENGSVEDEEARKLRHEARRREREEREKAEEEMRKRERDLREREEQLRIERRELRRKEKEQERAESQEAERVRRTKRLERKKTEEVVAVAAKNESSREAAATDGGNGEGGDRRRREGHHDRERERRRRHSHAYREPEPKKEGKPSLLKRIFAS